MKATYAAVLAVLALNAVAFVAGCGGKARAQGLVGQGGGGTAAVVTESDGGDAGGPNTAAPSVVRVADGSQYPPEDSDATAECLPGFQGFYAKLADRVVDFKAFVFEPGDYTGDPVKILYLDVRQTGGAHYQAAAGTGQSTGSISLHVEAIEPRFVGHLSAVLTNLDDATASELRLSLEFDIATRVGCE